MIQPQRPKRATAVDRDVALRLRLLRLERGLSLEQLAGAVGLSYQQVQKYEAGKNRVSAGRLKQIADVLGVSIAQFFAVPEMENETAAFGANEVRMVLRLQRLPPQVQADIATLIDTFSAALPVEKVQSEQPKQKATP